MRKQILVVLITVLFLQGCSTVGHNLKVNNIDLTDPGKCESISEYDQSGLEKFGLAVALFIIFGLVFCGLSYR